MFHEYRYLVEFVARVRVSWMYYVVDNLLDTAISSIRSFVSILTTRLDEWGEALIIKSRIIFERVLFMACF